MSANCRLPAKERSKTKPPMSEFALSERAESLSQQVVLLVGSLNLVTLCIPLWVTRGVCAIWLTRCVCVAYMAQVCRQIADKLFRNMDAGYAHDLDYQLGLSLTQAVGCHSAYT